MNFEQYLENVDRHTYGDIAKNCISSLLKCFEKNGVAPSTLPKFSPSIALRRGFPFTYINQEAYDNELFSKVCFGFSKNHKFNEDDFSEVSAVALLLALQAKSVTPIKRSSKKSHDFDVVWFSSEIEIEVTRPGEKDAWSKRISQSQEIVNFAAGLKRKFTIHIYLVDFLNQSDRNKLLDTIYNLTENQRIEETSKWLIISEEPYGNPQIIIENKKDENRPAWWPKHALNGFSTSFMIPAPGETEPLPRTYVKFSCPFNGYINTAKKKATNFQGTRTKPFILALDVNALGNPFDEFKRNLDHYFNKWQHITAVLIFIDHYSINEIGWEFQLFINPHATRQFDKKTNKILLEYTERKRIVKHYA